MIHTFGDSRSSFNLFEGQFFVTKRTWDSFEDWHSVELLQHQVYYHKSTEVCFRKADGAAILVVGYCYDFRNPSLSTSELVDAIKLSGGSLQSVINETRFWSGVYLVILEDSSSLFLIPDLCSLRLVYVLPRENTLVRAISNPALLDVLGLSAGVMPERWEMLKANHYYSSDAPVQKRFFPSDTLERKELRDVAATVASILKGIFECIHQRKEAPMVSLTGGWDSRMLLAASKDISSELIYFLNVYGKSTKYDLLVASRLAARLDLNFVAHKLIHRFRPDFALPEVIREEDGAVERYLQFDKAFGRRKTVSGTVSEIGRNFYSSHRVSAKVLYGLATTKSMSDCEQWITENVHEFRSRGYNPMDMFYWEEVLSPKLSRSLADAQVFGRVIFPPFNCRYLVDEILSVDPEFRLTQYNRLYVAVIQKLWPEALAEPINPGFKKRVIHVLQKMRIYGLYRTVSTVLIRSS